MEYKTIIKTLFVLSLMLFSYNVGEIKGTMHTAFLYNEVFEEEEYKVFNNFVSLENHLKLLNESNNHKLNYELCRQEQYLTEQYLTLK